MGFVIYVLGYKHNQIIFIIQTLCFATFKIDNTHLSSVYFGYNLKFSYYNFGVQMLEFLLEENYFEESNGNFGFLTKDANIIRILGVAIILAFINFIILLAILLSIVVDSGFIASLKKNTYSKYLLRTFEFVYKTTMYPLIFFSL